MRCRRARSGVIRAGAAIALGAALATCGCASDRLEYFPRQVVDDEEKLQRAASHLEETVARAKSPPIALVTAGESRLSIETRPYGRRGRREARTFVVPYQRIKWIKLFEGSEVRVGDYGDRTMLRLRFHTEEDAQQFADLLHSLRYWEPIAAGPQPPSELGFDEPTASTSSPPARRP